MAAPRTLLGREERQAQLLRAAATAFARGGYAATSMDDVAAEAGVTKLIVYRHFDSKDELYRSALTAVTDRMTEEFVSGLAKTDHERSGFLTQSILTVARENPDGFRLLTIHAAREPEFAALHHEVRARQLGVADAMIADMIPDPAVKAWASRVIVDYLMHGVLAWLDVGSPDRDEEFVEVASHGLRGMFLSWADPDRIPADWKGPAARSLPAT